MNLLPVLHKIFELVGAFVCCSAAIVFISFLCFLASEWLDDRHPARHIEREMRVLQGGRRR
jgi:hypothetical protein